MSSTHKVSSNSVLWLLTSWKSIAEPVQADPGYRSASVLDDLFGKPIFEGFGNERRPGQLHGGLSSSGFSTTTAPTMDQGSNPSSHMIPLHHQWNTSLPFKTGNLLLDNFGAPPLFSTPGYMDPASLMGLMLQNQPLSVTGNSQSDAFQFGAQLVGRG